MVATRSMNRPTVTIAFRACLAWMMFLQLLSQADAILGKKKKKQAEAEAEAEAEAARLEALAAEEEAQRLAGKIIIGGMEFDKTGLIIMAVAVVSIFITEVFIVKKRFGTTATVKRKGNRPDAEGTVDFVIVGCGMPKRGMGWYHLIQAMEMKSVNVRGVVEPFFLNKDLCADPPKAFLDLVSSMESKGVECVSKVADLGPFTKNTICLIAGRTNDNPRLFKECVQNGAKVIYLEKPGAPTVTELQDMSDMADAMGVKVYIGYNKNVTSYVQSALQCAKDVDKAHVFFCHNNSYAVKELPECFSRCSEGMLKNMAIHELALLVTFFGVTVDTIDKFEVNTNKLFSEKLTVWEPGTSMPNPKYITDFSRIAFKITTKTGTVVSVMADRCGGNVSFAAVKDDKGQQVKKFEFPDEETQKKVEEQCKADPEMMPYFFIQSDDYDELKTRVVNSALNGTDAEGVATIKIGIEALKLAEYGTTTLNEALKDE